MKSKDACSHLKKWAQDMMEDWKGNSIVVLLLVISALTYLVFFA